MVKVATRPAENPMGIMAKKLSLGELVARVDPWMVTLTWSLQVVWVAKWPAMLPTCHCQANWSSPPPTPPATSPCWGWGTL